MGTSLRIPLGNTDTGRVSNNGEEPESGAYARRADPNSEPRKRGHGRYTSGRDVKHSVSRHFGCVPKRA
eukprot:7450040-Heterocapsa_arctica.AAC.1